MWTNFYVAVAKCHSENLPYTMDLHFT